MFIWTLIASVLIGFILKGKLKNLSKVSIDGVYLILIAFIIEAVINALIIRGLIHSNIITYSLDSIMYLFISAFVIKNRKNPWFVLMGVGFLFNAVAIFANGGTMPVSAEAAASLNLTQSISSEGLYTAITNQTNFKLLCDFIPLKFTRSFVISIGDIILAFGMMGFIITAMKSKDQKATV